MFHVVYNGERLGMKGFLGALRFLGAEAEPLLAAIQEAVTKAPIGQTEVSDTVSDRYFPVDWSKVKWDLTFQWSRNPVSDTELSGPGVV